MSLSLKYPSFDCKTRKIKNTVQIFDNLRKRWLVLTPEEWVRQHVLNYLVVHKEIAPGYISIEKEIELNGTQRRYDIVVYHATLKPWLVIECKAPFIELNQMVLDQALRYNLILNADLVMITNGVSDYTINQKGEKVEF